MSSSHSYVHAVKALGATMLFSAGIHLLILGAVAVATGNWQLVNYFHIIGLTLFFPAMADWHLASVITMLALYSGMYVGLLCCLSKNKLHSLD